jgi:hypothetical protein
MTALHWLPSGDRYLVVERDRKYQTRCHDARKYISYIRLVDQEAVDTVYRRHIFGVGSEARSPPHIVSSTYVLSGGDLEKRYKLP